MSDFLIYNDSVLQMDSKLILCIEEHDSKRFPDSIDTRLFIGWSNTDNEFFVRGKRQNIGNNEYVPYAFNFKFYEDLYNFIKFVVGTRETTSLILYNYNNFENLQITNKDKLTYDFFEEYMDKNYEIAAYDDVKLNRASITRYLCMLQNTYNSNNVC